ncbi:MAG: 16S rRNA (guanine(966)-N(2))-methyltransferase RsmD [Eubacteriales bacterium]|jgi:16S rRNA (guanine966-N2)-methyltransferase|nr:16S rRNA (guanine(966)-N(2))-methyltransferase RsmD [Eubacteriales bacterium]
MRIITGTARGMRLETLEGDTTRPTSERVKEALFSMIQFDIEGRQTLDLFAGSGQLGLEALSRGAAKATFVDSSTDAVNIIKRNAQKTGLYSRCVITGSDWVSFIRGTAGRERYGIIFIDPPFGEKLTGEVALKLAEADLIADHAMIICESGHDEDFEIPGLRTLRRNKYGKTYIRLLTKEPV